VTAVTSTPGGHQRRPILFLVAARLSPTNARLLAGLRALWLAAEWLPPELAGLRVRSGDTVFARIDVLGTFTYAELDTRALAA
jgi:hypothetical protein